MNGGETLDVLKQIRDEVRQTNVRLESLEGRFEFLERRVSKGFEQLSERIDRNGERVAESEAIIAAEIVELAEVNRQIRLLLVSKLEDHDMVLNHEARIRVIEVLVPTPPPE